MSQSSQTLDQPTAPWGNAPAGEQVAEGREHPAYRGSTGAASEVICACMQVQLGTLQQCVARGCSTVEALARETGVTTTCGGCLPRVAALVHEQDGLPARITGVRKLRPDVWCFRLAPLDPLGHPLQPSLPGQHVIVSGLVGSTWVSRPYTLTSPAGSRPFREITVKLEPEGALSPWLFGRQREFTAIRLTAPRGDFVVDLEQPEPLIFLVGGIGVTPAIAVARTLVAEGKQTRLHVDYSVRDASQLVFREELKRLAVTYENITVRFRATGAGERLGAVDVERYRRNLPDARYFICGPEAYQRSMLEHLDRVGVARDRIQVESFHPPRSAPAPANEPAPPAPARRLRDTLLLVTGVALLLAYVAQGALDLRWPVLEALQEQETYRRWSGALLLGLVAAQWVLPVLRLRDRLGVAAAAYQWHRLLGVLAPVFFFAHAMRPGYGYLLALTLVFLGNVAVGLADKTLVREPARREWYGRLWLVPHVALACLTVGLALFHIVVVFAYR